MIKTIKIPATVHKELKVYIANNENETMVDVAGYAIMEYLRIVGHKFTTKPKSQSPKK